MKTPFKFMPQDKRLSGDKCVHMCIWTSSFLGLDQKNSTKSMSVDSASYPVLWTIILLILERWCKWDDQVIILEVVTQKKKIRGKSMNEGLPDIKQEELHWNI